MSRFICCAGRLPSSESEEGEQKTSLTKRPPVHEKPASTHTVGGVSTRMVELTIPPTPAGPFEEAEKRMRSS